MAIITRTGSTETICTVLSDIIHALLQTGPSQRAIRSHWSTSAGDATMIMKTDTAIGR